MLEHGGKLNEAITRYGHAREAWLDLSTGVNPQSWPVPELPAQIWHRLPEHSEALQQAACAYYGAQHLLPLAGSQAAIQALPRLRSRSRVLVAAPVYAEHAYRWRQAGHDVNEFPYADLEHAVDSCDVMVVCNPNNPSGARVDSQTLLDWAARLASRGGWLIVDEAFIDVEPERSVAAHAHQPGLIVLRSLGKFFGLAGVRLGFAIAEPVLLQQLEDAVGPWGVSAAAQTIGAAALSDTAWQRSMRAQLQQAGVHLQSMLELNGMRSKGCALFQWWPEVQADRFAHHMALRAIWVRKFFAGGSGIRLGLPYHEADWQRLQRALQGWRDHCRKA